MTNYVVVRKTISSSSTVNPGKKLNVARICHVLLKVIDVRMTT